MKTKLLIVFVGFVSITYGQSTTCANAASGGALANGGCLNNQTLIGSANETCTGPAGPAVFIKFVAGSCPQFQINPDFNLAPNGTDFGYIIYSSTCVAQISECIGNIVNQQDFTVSGINSIGSFQTTVGSTYILELYGATVAGATLDICYNANVPEAASNECTGALNLGPSPTSFFNGGDCAFNGTLDDTPSNPSLDGSATQYCAGTLESTQWVNWSPTAGSASFTINGSGINCTGGDCSYQFGIFSGACGALVNEGCVSNGSSCLPGHDPSIQASTVGGNVLTWSGIGATGFTATITPPSGTFTGLEKFYLAMDGNVDAQCYYTLTGSNLQALPIELISFITKKYNNANMLLWEVASEKNNDYFTLEKSSDGDNWQVIETIQGAGTSQEQKKYNTLDFDVLPIINYYRLKQTDYDGKFQYSEIISADNRNVNRQIIAIHNFLGENVTLEYSGIKIIQYSDGTIEKRY